MFIFGIYRLNAIKNLQKIKSLLNPVFEDKDLINKTLKRLLTQACKRKGSFIQTLCPMQKQKPRMINLLQENIEMKSHRTNSTFGFFADTQAKPKKPKEQFFAYALTEL